GASRQGKRSSSPANATMSPVKSERAARGGKVLHKPARLRSKVCVAALEPNPYSTRTESANPIRGTMTSTHVPCLETTPSISLSTSVNPITNNAATDPPRTPPATELAMVENNLERDADADSSFMASYNPVAG